MKNLFKSKTAYDILDLFVQNKDRSFYLSEIVKEIGRDPANVTREIDKLLNKDLLKMESKGKKKIYSLNLSFDYIQEIIQLFNKSRKSDFKEKFDTEWLLAEHIMNMDPFFSKIWCDCFVDQFEKQGGKAYKKIACIYRDYNLWFSFDKKDACEVGEHLVNRFEDNPDFMDEVNENIIKSSDVLVDFSKKVPEDNLDKLSNKELWKFYSEHVRLHSEYYEWGWIPVASDMFCDNLSNRGKKILIDMGVKEDNVNIYLDLLTQPTKPSLLKIEDDELKKIAIKVQKDKQQFKIFKELYNKFKEESVKIFSLYAHTPEYEAKFEETVKELVSKIKPGILKDLQNHYAKYFYTKFIFTEEQGVYNFEHYLKSLVRLVSYDDNIVETAKVENDKSREVISQRNKLIKELKLEKKYIQFFNAWGDFMVTKIYRRYAQLFALYKIVHPLEEIATRLGVSLKELKFMTGEEVNSALFDRKIDKEIIKKRVPFSVYYTSKKEKAFYIEEQAERAVKFLETEITIKVSELSGQCGCRGHAKGTVKIVNVIADMNKMEQGDILVSISTQPDLLPAMKKAAAFITNQGGVTSHAAIVAREMNTPCVIATKIATKVLKDGDIVEVDADKGIVKIVKKG